MAATFNNIRLFAWCTAFCKQHDKVANLPYATSKETSEIYKKKLQAIAN